MSSLESPNRIKLQKYAAAIQQNRYVSSVSNGLILTIPVLIAGALFTLIDSVGLEFYQNFLITTGLKEFTSLPADVTTNIISLYAVLAISYTLAKSFEKDAFTAAILSLLSFLLITPLDVLPDGQTKALSYQWLGSQGLFVAIILAILMTRVYSYLKDKGIYIRMPNGVPPTIEKSFAAITPGILILVLTLIIRAAFSFSTFGNMHAFIFNIVQAPLTSLGGTWWAFLICVLVMSILWFFGIHGTMVVLSVMIPLWIPAGVENLTAYQQGVELPNMVPGLVFYMVYTNIGGAMAAIGLAIAMLKAKSKRYQTLGKLSIIPSLFGINEPIIFGTPLVLNLTFLIPTIVTPVVVSALAIAATYLKIVPPLRGIGVPLGTPIFISGFIEGGIRVAFFQLVLSVVSILIYWPFFKKADKDALLEENESQSFVTEETQSLAVEK